jgi:hypothetical protein
MAKTTNDVGEIRSVTIAEAGREVEIAFKVRRPIYLHGSPGLGKSELIEELAAKFKAKVWDLRLALMDPSDLKGVLYFNPELRTACWSSPPDLPTKEEASKYPMTILFLDELNSAPPMTQAAAYQLILNRKVGTYELPENCVVVAAGNKETDRGVTYKMPSPLANRLIHLYIRPDFACWSAWALDNRIDPSVVGYLTSNKGDLFNFNPKNPGHAFATPRSWAFVSQLLGQQATEKELIDLVAGTVGEGLALKFNTHRKRSADMPNPTLILEGKIKDLKNKDLGAMYSLTTSLCYEMKDAFDIAVKENKRDTWEPKVDNVLRFVLDNFENEMIVMLMYTVLNQYKLNPQIKKLVNFKEFHNRCGSSIMEAMSR